MKIAIVVTKIGRGGAQRVSVVLAGYLKRRGHQVSILYYDGNGTYPLEEGLRGHQLPYSKNVILKHGKRIRAFMRYFKENQIELVLALFRGYDYTWLYRTCSSSRLILSQRNDPKAEYDHHVVARWESRFFFRGADAVVFQTEEERDYFGKAIQKKSLVIPNPVMNGIPKPYEGQRKKMDCQFLPLGASEKFTLAFTGISGCVRCDRGVPPYDLWKWKPARISEWPHKRTEAGEPGRVGSLLCHSPRRDSGGSHVCLFLGF